MTSSFQLRRLKSIRLVNFHEGDPSSGRWIGLQEEGRGSNGSSQTETLCPIPISQRDPFRTRSHTLKMLRQVKEGLTPKSAARMDELGKYLARRTRLTKELGNLRSHQNFLASNTSLRASRSRKPRPPSSFLFCSFPKLTQCIFFLYWLWPHQKLLIED